jgi:hypothetical protein
MIHYFHSGMTGVPTFGGSIGSMIALLDACLVNGWGEATVDSIVVAGGVATVTRAAGIAPIELDTAVLISGATPSALNGLQKVLSVSGSSYTFATSAAAGTATGTITHKLAPLGWTKPFSGTNLAAYRLNSVDGTGMYLRVDDTSDTTSRVVGYESMSNINTGDGPFPTAAQQAGGLYWAKAQNAGAREWTLIGDARGFYLWVYYLIGGAGTGKCTQYFGDFNSRKSPDPFACTLSGGSTFYSSNAAPAGGDFSVSDADALAAQWIPRSYTGLGSCKQAYRVAYSMASNAASSPYSGGSGMFQNYPNGADNGLLLTPFHLCESTPVAYRGDAPGAYFCPQNAQSSFVHRDRVTDVVGLPGRALRALHNGQGVMFVDVTGPWR